ncbi:hypothetical protein [Streptomyces sp. BH104]|uniref:hypothetical protein n=1 Tax=Streptomyces sp. BH104 TaxID=3410407 RepID=UPI003BB5F814
MPQKRNPQLCQDILGITAEVRALVPLALESLHNEHEADHAPSALFDAQARACVLTGESLERLILILGKLCLNPERMRSNLALTGGLISAEAIMIELGQLIGRQHAHEVIYDAAQKTATGGRSFPELLAADPLVTAHLDPAAIQTLLDPNMHTGQSRDLAHEAARRGHTVAGEIREALGGHPG